MDVHTTWLLAGIQGSVKDGQVSEKLLVKNLVRCYVTVKKSLSASEEKYEDFKKAASKLILLSCPIVHSSHHVMSNKDLVPTLKNLPSMSSKVCLGTLLSLKQLVHLKNILPEFGFLVSLNLLQDVLQWDLHNQEQYSVIFEIFQVIFSLEDWSISQKEVFECLSQWISLLENEKWDISCLHQYSGKLVYIMLSLNMLHDFVGILKNQGSIAHFDVASQQRKVLCEHKQWNKSYLDVLMRLFLVLEKASMSISSLVWIELDSVPADGFRGKQSELSMQAQIGQLAFSVKKVLDQHPILHSKLKNLIGTLAHLSIDPNYDAAGDLSTKELIQSLEEEGTSSKLMTLLAQRKDIFEFDDARNLLKDCSYELPHEVSYILISNIITYLDENVDCESFQWRQVALTQGKLLDPDDIKKLLEKNLEFGTKDVLLCEDLSDQITSVLNQFASSNQQNMDYFPYLLVCLQSTEETIKRTVGDAFKMQGFAPLAASALKKIDYLCLEPSGNGVSRLVNCLEVGLTSLTPDAENLFPVFIEELLKLNIDEDYDYKRTAHIRTHSSFISEIVHNFILPALDSESEASTSLATAVKILEGIVTNNIQGLLTIGSVLNDLLVMLVLTYHNACVQVSQESMLDSKIRGSLGTLLITIFEEIKKNDISYGFDIDLLLMKLQDHDLHPYCSNVLDKISPSRETPETYVDEILHYLTSCDAELGKEIKDISKNRARWIFGLSVVLPYCNEDQWLAAMKVTHISGNFKDLGEKISRVLNVFKQVLIILSADENYQSGGESFNAVFKKFSTSAINFYEDEVSSFKLPKKIDSVLFVASWWCGQMTQWECDEDMMTSLLNKFIQILKDYIAKRQVAMKKLDHSESALDEDAECHLLSKTQLNFLSQVFIPNFTYFVPGTPLKSAIAHDIESFIV